MMKKIGVKMKVRMEMRMQMKVKENLDGIEGNGGDLQF